MAQATTAGPSAFAPNDEMHNQTAEPDGKTFNADVHDKLSDSSSEEHMQDGVKDAEALTMSWTKKSLGLAYALYVT